jgi:hypothetical protein
MARSIEQVGQDLHHLQAASSKLGTELTAAYQSYFTGLAPTLKQQSIQSCYHLCTTCYPDAFLKLNYNQRAQLLKTLQRVIGNVIANLVVHINSPGGSNDNDNEQTGELTSIPIMPIDWFATPTSLVTWHQNIESEIAHRLKEISYKVNLLLQQARIMPANIPKSILEANNESDRQGESTVNIPNLLSIFIEQELNEEQLNAEISKTILQNSNDRSISITVDSDEEDFSQIVQIHSLYLRLTEVEFSDVNVLSLRKNIEKLVDRSRTLRREYLQKQQELKIAEAESAWRNSWFED